MKKKSLTTRNFSCRNLSKTVATLTLAIIATASCNESSVDNKLLAIIPLNSAGITIYADQETTTGYSVYSTAAWTLTSTQTWLTVTPNSGSAAASGTYGITPFTLTTTPNTTGAGRAATLNVSSQDDFATSMPVVQYGHLNITRPQVDVNTTSLTHSIGYSTLPAAASSDSIALTIYTDSVTITTSDSWIEPDSTTLHKGRTRTAVLFEANTGATRTGTITLTSSNGVVNTISVAQRAGS